MAILQETDNLNLELADEKDILSLHLENFDGPLDLLLTLIKSEKISIRELFVSKVTDQFLKYVEESKSLNLKIVGEYLVVAATLLEIKSKEMLPKFDDDLETNEEELLFQQLEEYKLFKDTSKKLKELEEKGVFYKESKEEFLPNYVFKESEAELLKEAFKRVMLSIIITDEEIPEEKIIKRETVSVKDAENYILTKLKQGKQSFFSFFQKEMTKSRVVVTFLAMLEMVKDSKISISQENAFGDIILFLKENQK